MSQGLVLKYSHYNNIEICFIIKNLIYNGVEVYDLNNIIISSSRMYQEILDKGFNFNK